MNRKLFTTVPGLFTLAILAGIAFVPVSSASPNHTAAQHKPSGLTAQGIANARASGAPSRLVTMAPQSSLQLLSQATKIGPHALHSQVELTVALKLRNEAKLKSFLEQVQNPHSAGYHQWLTPAEFTARYGPTKTDVVQVTTFLEAHGIKVKNVSSNRILIHTQATTAQYEHAFGVMINDYELNGRRFYSTTDSPKLPRAIAPLVVNILGLDHGQQMYSHLLRRPLKSSRMKPRLSNPSPSLTNLSPLQIAHAYNYPDITDAGNGKGVHVAILTAESSGLENSTNPHDFWARFGLPDHTINVIPVGGDNGNTAGMGETLLDIEYSGAMGPGIIQNVYVAGDKNQGTFTDMYNRFTNATNPDGSAKNQVMTTSWGHPETQGDNANLVDDQIFMQAATEGISMFAAAGDNGSGDGTGQDNVADYPSSSPYITAANGTQLNITDMAGDYGSEIVWNDPECPGYVHLSTGGAVSQIFAKPDWQHGPGVPNDIDMRMNSDMAVTASCTHALLYLQLHQGHPTWYLGSGTSVAAAQLAGMFAIAVADNGSPLGQSNELIYNDVNASNYASDFHDVTEGSNGAFEAGPGWDHPTGWGSPNVKNFLAHIGIQGLKGTLTGSVTVAATGDPIVGAKVAVVTSTGTKYTTRTDNNGSYLRVLPTGDATVTVSDFGYANGTASVTITDGNSTSKDFGLAPAPKATLSGKVSDDSGHGYGLYAQIKINAEGFGQVADVWTNPKTGKYSIKLPKGFGYTLNAAAAFNGYNTVSADVTLDGNKTQNLALAVINTCTAPGYAFGGAGGFGSDFNGVIFPPEGWTTTNAIDGSPVVWKLNTDWDQDNWTGGTGTAAEVDSGTGNYFGSHDASLVTPPIEVASLNGTKLRYKANYYGFDFSHDALDLDISTDDGNTWTTILHWNKAHGTYERLPGENVIVDLAPYLPTSGSFQLRWRNYDLDGSGFDYYAQIDDVVIGSCAPLPGGLITGQVTDANMDKGLVRAHVEGDQGKSVATITNPTDPNLPVGTYLFFAPTGSRALTASHSRYSSAMANVVVGNNKVVRKNFALEAARLKANPDGLALRVMVNNSATATFALKNIGTGQGGFLTIAIDSPPPGSAAVTGPFALAPHYAKNMNLAAMSAVGKLAHQPRSAVPVHHAPAPHTAGHVATVFPTGFPTYGLGMDRNANDLWVGSPSGLGGDRKDHRFLLDGTNTGDTINVANDNVSYMADMAFDANTGMLWQVSVDAPSGDTGHIYELDPKTMQPTGIKVLIPSPQSERGLAFDPLTNTWYAGDFNSDTIYHFDASGTLLDSAKVGLPITGLAYNPVTGHLFVLTSAGVHAIYVLDVNNGYARLSHFDIYGFSSVNAGAGLGYDCAGDLVVSDFANHVVYVVNSGEADWCAYKGVPWLTAAPVSGTLNPGKSATISLNIDGTNQRKFTTSEAYLDVTNDTPYGNLIVPLTVTWVPQPVALSLTGDSSPHSVYKGDSFTYTLVVGNAKTKGHGTATATMLAYPLPNGVSYVASSGDANCTASAEGSTPAPAAVTGGQPGTVTCDLGTIKQGVAKTVTIAVKAEQAGTLTSHFTVAAREPNDSDKATLDLNTTVIGTADVDVSASNATISKGANGTVDMTIGNAGPDTATDVKFKISSGGSVKLVGATSSTGDCSSTGSSGLSCDVGDIEPGGRVEIQINVLGLQAGTASVQGQVTSSADDPDQDNDVTTAAVTVQTGNSGGGGTLGWLALAALLGLALAGAMISRFRESQRSLSQSFREILIMNRMLFTAALGLFALTILVGPVFVSVSLAAPSHASKTAQNRPSGLTQQGIENVRKVGTPSRLVPMTPQSSLKLLSHATKVGPHAVHSTIKLTVGLKLRNVAKLKGFLRQVQNPASPVYHQWLTPKEFTARYGPSKADVAQVVQFLKAHGIKVKSVSPNRILIHTQATTGAYEHALGVMVNDYTLNGRSFYSTTDNPKLPRAIAPLIYEILGLNHGAQLRPMHRKANVAPNTRTVWHSVAPPPATTGQYLNQLQFAKAYDWPSLTDTSNGAGSTIAILSYASGDLLMSDLHAYWAGLGLPDHSVTVVNVDGPPVTGGAGETTLDLEYSGAMAPGADIIFYEGGGTPSFQVFADTANKMVNDNIADVASQSWGGCDRQFVPTPAGQMPGEQIYMQAAAQGITMIAAAGDSGSADSRTCSSGTSNADYPSSSPYVLAANGTTLTLSDTSGTYGSETAWCVSSTHCTGGGDSAIFAQPTWQAGPGVPNTGNLMNSDMAMHAGGRALMFYINGAWNTGSIGTSFVAPEFAGLFAVADSLSGGRVGQGNELIYNDVNAGNYASDFRDVTAGNNGAHDAKVNWDYPTGWGSLKATSLLSHIGVQGPKGTLNGTVTAAATGSAVVGAKIVAVAGDGTEYDATTGNDGAYSRILPVGNFTITVSSFGYADGTASVSITDSNTITQNFALAAAPKATLSGTVTDGSGHGYGLYAEIKVSAGHFGQVADVWTDPKTGKYSIKLPKGFDYSLDVAATLNGYNPESADVMLDGNKGKNFALTVTDACTAPGYAFGGAGGFGADFNGATFPPEGWTTTNAVDGSPVVWKLSTDWDQDNWTGGTGAAAEVNSSVPGGYSGFHDASLVTPPIDVTSFNGTKLRYKVSYYSFGAIFHDTLDLDISTDGGNTWTTILHWNKSHGDYEELPGENVIVDLAHYLPPSGSFQLRWRYYDLDGSIIDFYAQIDDVVIGSCAPLPGGLITGQVTDVNTGKGLVGGHVEGDQGKGSATLANPADPNLPVGTYLFFASQGSHVLTAGHSRYSSATANVAVGNNKIVQKNFALKAARLKANPGGLALRVMVNNSATATFALKNIGTGEGSFRTIAINSPPPGSAAVTGPFALAPHYAKNMNLAAMSAAGKAVRRSPSVVYAGHSVAPHTAGHVVRFFPTGFPIYGLGVDRNANDLWVGSPASSDIRGDGKDHRFLLDGTDTGDTINVANSNVLYMADMAFDANTGMLWQASLDAPSGDTGHIYELDPKTMEPTGSVILIPSSQSERGLAFDPLTNTWYAGDFNSMTIYHFDALGTLLDSAYVGLPITGLAYNPVTGHLFVLTSNGIHDVYVLDANNGYARLSHFEIYGLDSYDTGSGLGYDCAGDLIVSDFSNNVVYVVNSGEADWCAYKGVPWLTAAPASGTLNPGKLATISLNIDGTNQQEFTTSEAYLNITNGTPYGNLSVPLTVTWAPQPVVLSLIDESSPDSVHKGDSFAYTLTVENAKQDNHGAATQTLLSYPLPDGVSYVASSGDASCAAAAGGSSPAPAAATGGQSGTVTCDFGTLEQGATKTVTIAVKAEQAGTLASHFEVAAREPNDSGKSALDLSTTVIGNADMGVSLADASLKKNQQATVPVTVSNAGPDTATDVKLKVTAGAVIAINGGSADQGGCTASGSNGYECDLGDVASGQSVTVEFTITGQEKGTASLTAQVATSAEDPGELNNVATASVTVKDNGGGGGALGWLALAALLGLGLTTVAARRRHQRH